LLQIFYFIVGWVEVTKPFGYAVPERSRRAGQRPTSAENLCWAVPALRLPFDYAQGERSVTATVEGFRYRSTQPTNSYNIILSVAFFFRFHIIRSK